MKIQENIALVKKKQKRFTSSVKQYKSLLKKGSITVEEKKTSAAKSAKKITKRVQRPRGIVYIGNTPHGFYERELIGYFGQFGVVTRVRCARSRKTGASKGYAFVEFQEPEVASIVAETMNNYLMGKRLLKAQYISPEEQVNKSYFKGKNFTADRYPALINRIKNKKEHNSILSEDLVKEKTMRMLKAIEKTQKKLKALDIIYNFKPVDVPSFISKLGIEGHDADSIVSSSDDEGDNSDGSIVFTPPEEMIKLIRKKISAKEPAVKLKKKKGKSNVGNGLDLKGRDKKLQQFKVTMNDSDVQVPKQSKKKEKLTGVSKKKSKRTKSEKLTDKKTKLIKQELKNQEQITLKTPKVKKEVTTPSKIKSKSLNKPKSPKKKSLNISTSPAKSSRKKSV